MSLDEYSYDIDNSDSPWSSPEQKKLKNMIFC